MSKSFPFKDDVHTQELVARLREFAGQKNHSTSEQRAAAESALAELHAGDPTALVRFVAGLKNNQQNRVSPWFNGRFRGSF